MNTLYKDVEKVLIRHLTYLDEDEKFEMRVWLECLMEEKYAKARNPDTQDRVASELLKVQFFRAGEYVSPSLPTWGKNHQ